jgi:hypothetical protein
LVSAEAAARELPSVALDHALGLCLLMAKENDARCERAMTRWAGRALAEHPEIGLPAAVEMIAGLQELRGSSPPTAGASLAFVLRAAGLRRCAQRVERFRFTRDEE